MRNNNSSRMLIFTGGHHTGALAVAQSLKNAGWDIVWFGHRHSQWQDSSDSAEYTEVSAAGIRFINLKAGKFYRTAHPAKLLRIPLGFIQAFFSLLGLKLKLGTQLKGIVSYGGYLGVPVVLAGWILGLPSLTHEQTVSAGWANRFIALFAKKIAVSWPSSLNFYPKSKTVLVGLTFRPEIVAAKKSPSPSGHLLYITGGKQGSHVINSALFEALEVLLKKYLIIHQTGSSTLYHDYDKALKIRSSLPPQLRSRYEIFTYLNPEQAASALVNSEIVISRAGAHIISELALLKTKSVLIPIPWSSHNEQLKNAQMLTKFDLAVILPQDELSGRTLVSAISTASRLAPKDVQLNSKGRENMVNLIESTF